MDYLTILELLRTKQFYINELESIKHGSIEIRNNKYLYIHVRKDGKSVAEYIGEYTPELYNSLKLNNVIYKDIKKKVSDINNKLKSMHYIKKDVSDNVLINIDFAKRYLGESIYKQSILEGISITLPDTLNIIEGGIINNISSNDITKVINLKHAWEFILDTNVISEDTNFNILKIINKFVLEDFYYVTGVLRTTPVIIGGTSWTQSLPIESDIKGDIIKIINRKVSYIDRAIELLLYIMKSQMFIDGNKRTAVIFANHYLISHGEGLISIPETHVEKFKELLIKYYEFDDKEIKQFLKAECFITIK